MNRIQIGLLFVLAATWTFACGGALGRGSSSGSAEEGKAVYYSDSLQGKRTASGEPYDKDAFTAAHRALPFGTVVRVTNLSNRHTVEVRINDRGPGKSGKRIIDLSRAAAKRLDMIRSGVADVRIEIVSTPDEEEKKR